MLMLINCANQRANQTGPLLVHLFVQVASYCLGRVPTSNNRPTALTALTSEYQYIKINVTWIPDETMETDRRTDRSRWWRWLVPAAMLATVRPRAYSVLACRPVAACSRRQHVHTTQFVIYLGPSLLRLTLHVIKLGRATDMRKIPNTGSVELVQ